MSKSKKISLLIILLLVVVLVGIFLSPYFKFLPDYSKQAAPLTPVQIENIKQNSPINLVKVLKSKRQVQLLHDNQIIRSYPMRLGFNPIGHKTQEGDGKTPEGRYTLDWRNPNSQFYKSLHISYPNQTDLAQAKARGVSAGGDVMIHGSANTQMLKVPKMMSYMPAKVMGLSNRGQLAPGFVADFVFFDDDINVKKVILQGKELQ